MLVIRSLLASMLTLAAATPAFADEPEPAVKPSPCTVVLGGGGTSIGDSKFDGMWHEINKRMTDALIAELRKQKFKAELVFSTSPDEQERFTEVVLNMKLYDCAKVLQVTHILNRGDQPSVDFEIVVFHIDESKKPKKGEPHMGTVVGEYTKKYHYEFDEKFMNGSLSERGVGYARDVIESGVLMRTAE
jgi:hypothetical protein